MTRSCDLFTDSIEGVSPWGGAPGKLDLAFHESAMAKEMETSKGTGSPAHPFTSKHLWPITSHRFACTNQLNSVPTCSAQVCKACKRRKQLVVTCLCLQPLWGRPIIMMLTSSITSGLPIALLFGRPIVALRRGRRRNPLCP